METIEIRTEEREQLMDITDRVQGIVTASGVGEGACVLWSSHTTAGLTVNEGADPDVARDLRDWLADRAPRGAGYRHREGNADAHIKTTLVGPGVTLIVSRGRLRLGRWQRVFLCEFDGPRTRRVNVQLLPAARGE